MRSSAVVAALVVATANWSECQPAPAVPLVGVWELNHARSHYGPGVDRRRQERMTCRTEGDRLRCVIESVRADGQQLTGRFTAPLDGTAAAVTGIPDVDQVRLSRAAPSWLDATFLSRGRPAFGYRAGLSDDGRSLIVIAVDPVTRAAATTVVVYDRR